MTRSRCVAPAAVLAAAALAFPAAAPAATAKTYKLKGGTTTLVLASQAVTNLTGAGVTMAAGSPAVTSGTTLRFPISTGKVKVKGKKVVSGKVVHLGTLGMSKGTTVLTLAKPTANLATPATFTAALEGVAQPVGNLDLSKAKVTITRKRLTIAKVKLTLTDTAAAVMNGLFDNPGFKAGDLVGTATLAAKVVK